MRKYDRDAPIDWDEMEARLADKLGQVIAIHENLKTNKMIKVSKIISCTFSRTWNGPNGPVHYYDLNLENGDYGNIGVKELNSSKISVGETLSYTIEQKGEYKGKPQFNIKAAQQPTMAGTFSGKNASTSNSKETDDRIARSVAIREAVALHAGLGLSALPYDVVNTAMYFEHYIGTGINLQSDGADDAKAQRKLDSEDLPF
jgi:hypothetical protein